MPACTSTVRSPVVSSRSSSSSVTLSAVVALPIANVTVRSAAAPSGKRSRFTSCVTSTVTVSSAAVDPVRLSVKPALPCSSRKAFLSFAIVTTGTSLDEPRVHAGRGPELVQERERQFVQRGTIFDIVNYCKHKFYMSLT